MYSSFNLYLYITTFLEEIIVVLYSQGMANLYARRFMVSNRGTKYFRLTNVAKLYGNYFLVASLIVGL